MRDATAPPGRARRDGKVIAIVGAGPGIGASIADRFARDGFALGLIARDGDRLGRMASGLRERHDVGVAAARADATDADQVSDALASISGELGHPSVLCFSPIPDVRLIRPVLDTGPEDLISSLRLNIGGAAAAVRAVLPGMRERGRGSLLFTTGSAALAPDQARAASAVTTTAATVYISLLHQALEGTGVRVGHTVIVGPVGRDRVDAHHPDRVADDVWAHHTGTAADFPTVLRLR